MLRVIYLLFLFDFILCWNIVDFLGFSGSSVVKNLPAMQETQVRLLGQEVPPEKG